MRKNICTKSIAAGEATQKHTIKKSYPKLATTNTEHRRNKQNLDKDFCFLILKSFLKLFFYVFRAF
jgi:hypothetical protein